MNIEGTMLVCSKSDGIVHSTCGYFPPDIPLRKGLTYAINQALLFANSFSSRGFFFEFFVPHSSAVRFALAHRKLSSLESKNFSLLGALQESSTIFIGLNAQKVRRVRGSSQLGKEVVTIHHSQLP